MELDLTQYDRPTACVIAQQYSYAALVSLRSHPHKGKFVAHFKNISISVLLFFKLC